MATEPADVLIIGAGASGGVVALRLAQAGFSVVCLEQGDWMNRADYPGNKLDWELKARKDWATSPNIRGLPQDYPIVEDDTPVSPLMTSDLVDSEEGRRRLRDSALGRFGRADEVAEAVIFLLSDRASLFLGQTLNPNAGGYMP